MFSYVWLHFKKCFEKYFLVFGCVLENSIENTFSTCCSHFLTFSRLPNEYIISFIPQYRTQTKPRKKSSNPVTFSHIFSVAKQQKHKHSGQIQEHKHFLGSTRGCDWRGALCGRNRWFTRSRSMRRRDRDRRDASRDLGDLGRRSRRSKLWKILASSAFLVARSKLWTISLFSWLSFFFLSLALSFVRDLEMV